MEPIFDWNSAKNHQLKQRYGLGFADVVIAFQERRLLADIPHPNQAEYPHQRLAVVNIENYAYAVPYVLDGKTRFLKTLFPSRKLQQQYLSDSPNND